MKAPERPLRTLQLGKSWFDSPEGGGLDRVFQKLGHHLSEAGVDVQGYVVGNGMPSSLIQGIAADTDPLLSRLWAVRRTLKNELASKHFDLVASHFALYTLPILDLIPSRSFVVHFHGPWASESEEEGENPLTVAVKSTLEKLVYRRAQRFIVLSSAFRKVLVERYGIPEERIRIVPGGVEADHFDTGLSRHEARVQMGWPTDRPLILSVRRLARRMGLENLVAAMHTVRQRLPNALLLIAGKGPLVEELKAQIQSAGLKQHVQLLGYVPDDDLPIAYRAADVSVVPTVALEGFGLITVESLASGTPVLVTPVGGLPEVVQDLSEHLVLPDTSTEALAEHLVSALEGTLPLPSAEACQDYARSRFDWSIIASRVRSVYEEVVS